MEKEVTELTIPPGMKPTRDGELVAIEVPPAVIEPTETLESRVALLEETQKEMQEKIKFLSIRR